MRSGAISLIVLAAPVTTVYAQKPITLYQDKTTGQVYTMPGDNREAMGDFIRAEKSSEAQAIEAEPARNNVPWTNIKFKVALLEFSGVHYLGYVFTDYGDETAKDGSKFEIRRNYFQVKAYWNETDYMRVTLDTFQEEGNWNVRLKYAYIYLADILPFTGVEFGQVHRPRIDYEEHSGWWYRSIAKTFIEEQYGDHLTNSADMGVNFKTATPYFSSELGIFNGEGYHGEQSGNGMSYEWRLVGGISNCFD